RSEEPKAPHQGRNLPAREALTAASQTRRPFEQPGGDLSLPAFLCSQFRYPACRSGSSRPGVGGAARAILLPCRPVDSKGRASPRGRHFFAFLVEFRYSVKDRME